MQLEIYRDLRTGHFDSLTSQVLPASKYINSILICMDTKEIFLKLQDRVN
jgi:hypothetical protein